MPSLLQNTNRNLTAAGLKIKEVHADAGYSSPEALKALKGNKITGYTPLALDITNTLEMAFATFPAGITTIPVVSNYPLDV
ncbi:hypothetical protein [Flavisolibacter nicotianae]|uniref:hypothetical protein n=1 Tax=Flavisolibacter nicotianae TaxID=2364882 RepID=UPI000EB1C63C|nr:hypothetical protein [Flavisolibacter nicotianae]